VSAPHAPQAGHALHGPEAGQALRGPQAGQETLRRPQAGHPAGDHGDATAAYELSALARKRIERELAKYPPDQRQSAVMSSLAIAQDEHGWVSPEVIEAVATCLGMPPIAVEEVATFYNMYNTAPVGRYKLGICTNLPCQLHEGAKAAAFLKARLGIDFNETTDDGLFTLRELECLGACGDAPVMLVNNKRMCSFMDGRRIDALITELRAAAASATRGA